MPHELHRVPPFVSAMIELQCAHSISAFDLGEWDALTGDDVLASHDWLRTLEETWARGAAGALYFAARVHGELVAAAACQRRYVSDGPMALDRLFYGRGARAARSAGIGIVPALVVGSQFAVSEPFIVKPGIAENHRMAAIRQIVAGILSEAKGAGATVVVRNATAQSPVDCLADVGFRSSPELPTAYLDIRWDSFDGYRRDLKTIHPATEKSIRNQSSRARRNGIVIERLHTPAEAGLDLHLLLDSHCRRLNGVPFPFGESFLARALLNLGERAVVIVARTGTTAIGVRFGLRAGGCSRAMMIGIDQGRGRAESVYYLLTNNAIANAIEAGDRRLFFGRLLYDLKLRRGCSLTGSTVWVRGRSALHRRVLRPFIGLRTRKMEAIIARYTPFSVRNAAGMTGGAT